MRISGRLSSYRLCLSRSSSSRERSPRPRRLMLTLAPAAPAPSGGGNSIFLLNSTKLFKQEIASSASSRPLCLASPGSEWGVAGSAALGPTGRGEQKVQLRDMSGRGTWG